MLLFCSWRHRFQGCAALILHFLLSLNHIICQQGIRQEVLLLISCSSTYNLIDNNIVNILEWFCLYIACVTWRRLDKLNAKNKSWELLIGFGLCSVIVRCMWFWSCKEVYRCCYPWESPPPTSGWEAVDKCHNLHLPSRNRLAQSRVGKQAL